MKTKWMISLMFAVLLLSACTVATMNMVIEEDIPFNVKEIIHTEKVKDGVILLYVTSQKNAKGEIDAVTVAFLKGNDQDGWKNAGHNHWEYNDNEYMTVYTDTFYDYDQKGKLENRLPVIYGKIQSEEIKSIEVKGQDQKAEKANIIEKESGRYFLKLGDYQIATGLTGDGKEVSQQE
ncbi:hypothetical protein BGM26_09460 [Bacillus sp. FJAT-29790]|uniref:hypothetical protein n=1 Tax=Bacillus sp. FJAT-29790 TaxID=1895002 RepID=UPI001C247DE2|nr:hypothetical protein [Bacillus sp. FJAT-29790]MBU8879210.1 hypothetical protein [Bacillus sp. FJAT-29790]